MKIIKLALQTKMIHQNPDAQNNPDIQLQNLQNAQSSFEKLKQAIYEMNIVMENLRKLEETLDIADIGARNEVQKIILEAIRQTPDFNMLAQMGLIANVNSLLNQADMTRMEVNLTKGIIAL